MFWKSLSHFLHILSVTKISNKEVAEAPFIIHFPTSPAPIHSVLYLYPLKTD